MNLIHKTSLAFLLLALEFSTPRFIASQQPEVSAAEYAVYAAVLDQKYSEGISLFVIEDHTSITSGNYEDESAGHFKWVKKHLPSLSQIAFNDFRNRNKESQALNRSFNLKSKYALISRARFEAFAGQGGMMEMSRIGWENFYSEYRGASGFLSLSRVGFDHKRNQALVFISHMRGNPSGRSWGDGSYLLLIKKRGVWRVCCRAELTVS